MTASPRSSEPNVIAEPEMSIASWPRPRPTVVEVQVLDPGPEPRTLPTPVDVVTIAAYQVSLLESGIVVDSSDNHVQPLTYSVGPDGGCGGVFMQAWEETLPQMYAGQYSRLVIPASKAFGAAGLPGAVPPDADLVVEIRIGQTHIRRLSGGWQDELEKNRMWLEKGKITREEFDEIHRRLAHTQLKLSVEAEEAKQAAELAKKELLDVEMLKEKIARAERTCAKARAQNDQKMLLRAADKLRRLKATLVREQSEAEEARANAKKEQEEAVEAVNDARAQMKEMLEGLLGSEEGLAELYQYCDKFGVEKPRFEKDLQDEEYRTKFIGEINEGLMKSLID